MFIRLAIGNRLFGLLLISFVNALFIVLLSVMLSLLKSSRHVCRSSVNIFHVSKVGTTSSTVINRKPWKLSATSIVEATPRAVQPYLRLMRADKPIGNSL